MVQKYFAKISGTGRYLPKKVLTNHDLERMVDTNDEWIRTRTGMQERRVAAEGETTSDLAAKAGQQAIEAAGLRAKDIEMVIVCTVTGDHAFPSTSCLVQKKLGIKNTATAFDVSAGCTGFIYGANIAQQFIENGTKKHILVIGAETLTRILNWNDRGTCVLFGDGAGAAVFSRAENIDIAKVIDSEVSADGNFGELLIQPAGGSKMPASQETVQQNLHTVHMEGNKIFKLAVKSMYHLCDVVLKRNKMDVESIDWLIPHQANLRIIQALGKKLKIQNKKVIVNIEKYANTSAATVPIALDEAIKLKNIRRGDVVLMTAFGAGLTSGALLFRY